MNELLNPDPMGLMPIEDVLRSMMRPWRMEMAERMPTIRMDLSETDTAYQIKAEIPGVRKEDIDVRVHGNLVQIDAEIKRESKPATNGDKLLRSERYQGNISRSFSLAQDIDEGKVKAQYDKGVLSLELPKKAQKDYSRVAIQ